MESLNKTYTVMEVITAIVERKCLVCKKKLTTNYSTSKELPVCPKHRLMAIEKLAKEQN